MSTLYCHTKEMVLDQTYANIAKEQRKDALLVNLLTSQADCILHTFRGGEKYWQLVISQKSQKKL
jgi:hypothetical protein